MSCFGSQAEILIRPTLATSWLDTFTLGSRVDSFTPDVTMIPIPWNIPEPSNVQL